MEKIQTFVFFDIETTGLLGCDPPKITELAFLACSREHLLEATKNEIPRVTSKLLLPVNPCKNIHPAATIITGLDNFMLEKNKKLDGNTVDLMNCFFNQLNAPICMVAHNGNEFDYPILRRQLKKMNRSLHADLLCVDFLLIFRKIDENATSSKSLMDAFLNTDLKAVQNRNEKTPSKGVSFAGTSRMPYEKPSSARQLFPSQNGSSNGNNGYPSYSQSPAKKSFKLSEIYKRLNNRTPDSAHNAEADAISLILCAIAVKDEFVELADRMAIKFDEIEVKF